MSQENVELARQYYEAWNAQRFDGSQHLRHPDIELIDPPNFPDSGRHVGEVAFRERLESYFEVGWDGQCRVTEYLDAGEEVVVIFEARGRTPHGGGVPVEQTIAHICLFEGGKVRRIRQYLSRRDALDAAGLRE